ncbi:hypothetical protein D3C73_1423310 [compost metagenome]
MTLKDVHGGQTQFIDGRQGTGVVRRHVITGDAGMPIALRLAEQAAQQMGTVVDPGFHVDAANQGCVMGQ